MPLGSVAASSCCYRVDEYDFLLSVDESYVAFANENGAPCLAQSGGRCIWDFLANDRTRRLYDRIHRFIRTTGITKHLLFRCDAPGLKQFMQLSISLEGGSVLCYQSTLLHAEPQPNQLVLDPSVPRTNSSLTMCSLCKRINRENGDWVGLESLATDLQLDRWPPPGLTYSICPECPQYVSAA